MGGWLRFSRRTTVPAFLLSVAFVVVGALVAKWLIEEYTQLTYEIHWTTTVPVLVVLFTLALNFEFNARRARRRPKEEPPHE